MSGALGGASLRGAKCAMPYCRMCGRLRDEGTKFCTGCGAEFPDSTISQPAAADRADKPAVSRRLVRPIPIAAVTAVALGIAVGAWLLVGRNGVPQANVHELTRPTAAGGQNSPVPATSAPSTSAPTPSQSATVGDTVSVSSAAALEPDATSVANFLGQYFTAINAHDYQSYVSLLNPQMQQDMTDQQFESGYQSTVDSDETLNGISAAADGDTVVAVTFTSHQNPAASVDQQEACTDWKIWLFLEQSGAGYLIDSPPSDYHASHAAC